MLPGFPKTFKTKKLQRGKYLIIRDDGYSVTARAGWGRNRWWINGCPENITLGTIKGDMIHGYTPYDQLRAREKEADLVQRGWERAMGMRGYRGSPAENEAKST